MRKLLIADDNPDLAYAMQRLLSFYDFTARVVKDSKSLVAEVESFKPDIILIDVFLGGEDGREICKELRADPVYKTIPLILFSASPKDLENFRESGADGAIAKPFAIPDMINQIKFAVLNRKETLSKLSQ